MLEQLKNPPMQYRMAFLWEWPCVPDAQEVDRQIREMHGKGIGGLFIVNQQAGPVEGLGEDLLRRTQQACDLAARLGMQVYQPEDAPEDDLPPVLEMKARSSAFHLEGRSRVHAGIHWDCGCSLAEMKRQVDRQACLGANFFWLADGTGRIAEHPEPVEGCSTGIQQAPYWRYFKHFADYAARLGYVMSQGYHQPQAAVVWPETLAPESAQWLEAISECLMHEHLDFDLVPADAVGRAKCHDERLVLDDERYSLAILPPMQAIPCEAASKLFAFAEDGGKVIAIRPLPAEDCRGDKHAQVREALAVIFEQDPQFLIDISRPSDLPASLGRLLKSAIKPDISVRHAGDECPDIRCAHRRKDNLDLFFLANQSAEAREVRVSVRCDGAPHLVNLESGDITALPNCTQQGNRTVLLHRFEGYGSLLMAFSEEPAFVVAPPAIEDGQEIAMSDEWEFTTDPADSPEASKKHFRSGSWTDQGYPHYSGTSAYKQTVFVPQFARGQRVILRAIDPADMVEFVVNGAVAAVRPWAPFEAEVTALVKPGPNTIEIRVSNSLANSALSQAKPSGLLGGAEMLLA